MQLLAGSNMEQIAVRRCEHRPCTVLKIIYRDVRLRLWQVGWVDDLQGLIIFE